MLGFQREQIMIRGIKYELLDTLDIAFQYGSSVQMDPIHVKSGQENTSIVHSILSEMHRTANYSCI